jgi:hypothetical protein
MKNFKKAKVVMLPTENKTNIIKFGSKLRKELINLDKRSVYYQHLYIISDDEIKVNDYLVYNNEIYQYHDNLDESCKKIIATTDTSLKTSCTCTEFAVIYCSSKCQKSLLQPSQQFIERFIESYNKGEVITDVLVEYLPSSITLQTYSGQEINDNLKALSLKVNPKDNTITIKELKDSWNREEVIKLCKSAMLLYKNVPQGYPGLLKSLEVTENKWIEENL